MEQEREMRVEFPRTSDGYELLNQIGVSERSSVYKAKLISNGTTVAIKIMSADCQILPNALQTQSTIRHPNIVTPHCCFNAAKDRRLWIVMPFFAHRSLQDVIDFKFGGGLKEKYTAIVVSQLLLGLESVHRMGLVHGAIKPSNVFLGSDCAVLLSDYNVCEDDHISPSVPVNSSMAYWLSPEEDRGQKADIWCLGVLALKVYYGGPPIQGSRFARSQIRDLEKRFQYCLKIEDKMKKSEHSWKVDESLKSFVGECLNKDAMARPSPQALLNHAFIKNAELVYTFKTIPRGMPEIGERFESHKQRILGLITMNKPEPDQNEQILDFCEWGFNKFLFEMEPLIKEHEKLVRFDKPGSSS